MLQRSAENRHLRPVAGTLENSHAFLTIADARSLHNGLCSRRCFVWGFATSIVTIPLAAQQSPRRIVSTAPSITEALFALSLGDQVVGVSRYCNYPPQVSKLPKVGSYVKPDLEAIARLAPSLVVLQNAASDVTDRLKALRIAFVEVPHGSLEDVFTGIQIMGASTGVTDRSARLVAQIRSSLEKIQSKARTMPSPRVIAILNRRPGTLTDLTAVGPDNYVNQILEIAGATNILAKVGLPRYPHISLETVLRENPDVILDLSSLQDTEAMRQSARPAVLSLWRENRTLKAVQSGHVYFGTSNALLVPGPRAPEAAEMLLAFMHNGAGEQS
jgi:iron complex transport system substrate-binding protein